MVEEFNETLGMSPREWIENVRYAGMPAYIKELQLLLEYGDGETGSACGEGADYDYQEWRRRAQCTIEFLKGVLEGKYPENWNEVPDWSIEENPYEAIVAVGIALPNDHLKIFAEKIYGKKIEELEPAIRDRFLTDWVILFHEILQEKAIKGEIKGYDIEQNELLKRFPEMFDRE